MAKKCEEVKLSKKLELKLSKKQKYLDTAKMIETIVEQFKQRNVLEYLRGIAQTYKLTNPKLLSESDV